MKEQLVFAAMLAAQLIADQEWEKAIVGLPPDERSRGVYESLRTALEMNGEEFPAIEQSIAERNEETRAVPGNGIA